MRKFTLLLLSTAILLTAALQSTASLPPPDVGVGYASYVSKIKAMPVDQVQSPFIVSVTSTPMEATSGYQKHRRYWRYLKNGKGTRNLPATLELSEDRPDMNVTAYSGYDEPVGWHDAKMQLNTTRSDI